MTKQELLNQFASFKIPDYAKRIKIDIGTSCNAPHSENWTNNDLDCFVIAFEPNTYNIQDIYDEAGKQWPVWLKKEKIEKRFYCFNCALSNEEGEVDFYCTLEDGGTSSLFKPKFATIKDVIKIQKIRLDTFFQYFDWNRFPVIDQVKIDAQSADFSILNGIGDFFEKIAYIDIETHTNNQYENEENPQEIKNFLESKNFECLNFGINATFINKLHKYNKDIKYSILNE